jgi:tripeptide aminopeptidase
MGLPCPNLFAGEHAFHSLEEWVSVQDMEKSSEMIIHLTAIWANHKN